MRKLYFAAANNFNSRSTELPLLTDTMIEKHKLNRSKVYWICQISGWLLFCLINIIFIASFEELTFTRMLAWVFLLVSGILLTHYFRSIIKKYHWLDLPLKKIIPRVLGSSLALGAIIYSLTFVFNISLSPSELDRFRPITPVIGIFNLSAIVLLWSLIYFSVHFFENYKKAEIESLIWEAAVKDFELKTLKSQLNPHFMFNAMNSIRALIEEDPQNAKIALTRLSNILRYSLKIERNETVPFEEEMQTVADYLALETIRFEERLKYNIKIEPGSSKIEVPPMMIQTLVENGIKHGISKRTEGGKIEISSFVRNSNLVIEIKNSGRLDDDAAKFAKGFGINNTKQRLNLLYGENAKFTINNENSESVKAELVIPIGGTIR